MAVTDEVLRILEARRGETVSGEEAAAALGLSRAAVWKAVTALRARGFGIEAGSNRGYALVSDGNRLHPETVRRHLIEKYSTGTIVLSGLIRLAFSTIPVQKLPQLFANVDAAVRDLRGAHNRE